MKTQKITKFWDPWSEQVWKVSKWKICCNTKKVTLLKNFFLSFQIKPVKRTTNTAWKVSKYGVFLVRVSPHLDWIRRDTRYLSVFSPNAGKYGPEKVRYLDTFHTVKKRESKPCLNQKTTRSNAKIIWYCKITRYSIKGYSQLWSKRRQYSFRWASKLSR